MTMRRTWIMALLAVLLAAGAEAQGTLGGGPYLWSSSTQRGLEAADVATSLTATTTGTAPETLRTWTIPAGVLTSRPGFRLVAVATTVNNANTKTLTVRVGGAAVCAYALTTGVAASGQCEVECWVRSATQLQCRHFRINEAGNINAGTAPVTVDFAAAIPVLAQGTTNAAAGDMTLVSFTSYFFRP
jgi:hypothetical protein